VDEARQIIARLTERNTAQGHLLQSWKQRLKQQVVQLEHFDLVLFFLSFLKMSFCLTKQQNIAMKRKKKHKNESTQQPERLFNDLTC
jgi:hypothetical protein